MWLFLTTSWDATSSPIPAVYAASVLEVAFRCSAFMEFFRAVVAKSLLTSSSSSFSLLFCCTTNLRLILLPPISLWDFLSPLRLWASTTPTLLESHTSKPVTLKSACRWDPGGFPLMWNTQTVFLVWSDQVTMCSFTCVWTAGATASYLFYLVAWPMDLAFCSKMLGRSTLWYHTSIGGAQRCKMTGCGWLYFTYNNACTTDLLLTPLLCIYWLFSLQNVTKVKMTVALCLVLTEEIIKNNQYAEHIR